MRGSRPTQRLVPLRTTAAARRSAKFIDVRVPGPAGRRCAWRRMPPRLAQRYRHDAAAGPREGRRDQVRDVGLVGAQRCRPGRQRRPQRGDQRGALERGIAGTGQTPPGHHATAGARKRLHEAVVHVGRQQHAAAGGRGAQPAQRASHALERLQLVAQLGCLLEALIRSQRRHPHPQAGHRRAAVLSAQPAGGRRHRAGVLLHRGAAAARCRAPAQQPGQAAAVVLRQGRPAAAEPERRADRRRRGLRLAAASQRAGADGARPRLGRDGYPRHPLIGGQRQVAAALGVDRATVRIRPQPQDQLQLEQRRLQLAAQRPRLDAGGRLQGVLHGAPLPGAREVRAHPRAQVGGLPDVQHPVVGVVEQVDAGPGRDVAGQLAAQPHATALGSGEGDRLGDGANAVLLGHAQQVHQHLGRGLRVGQRAVAGANRGVEPLRQRAQVHARQAPLQKPPRQRHRVDHGRSQPAALEPRQLGVDEADVEAGVVGDQHGALGELEERRQRPR